VKTWLAILLVAVVPIGPGRASLRAQESTAEAGYLGFDRNQYPGDENLAALRRTFSFTGYWLNAPPGTTANSWSGKRTAVRAAGLGFLVLFNGRLDEELKKAPDPGGLGKTDAAAAVASAQREGFPGGAVIFLDIEEGGRMLPEQKAYIYAWVDAVNASGFRAGVYCSGVPAAEGHGVSVITALDLKENARGRSIIYWVINDACPPSPGCVSRKRPPLPSKSGVAFAEVWQFAQTPKRRDVARGCRATYARDGNCYSPAGVDGKALFVDLDSADSEDPSSGR
jgi:hypothetical protein